MSLRLFIVFLIGQFLLGHASTGFAADKVILQLKWTHAFQFAGYYAAKELGYYSAAGLDVDFREISDGLNVVDEVTAGRANYGTGSSSLLLDRQAGKPVLALAVIFQHSPYIWIAARKQNNQSIHDLIGQRLSLENDADELRFYLQQEGVPLDKVIIQKHQFSIDALLAGKTDAMSAYSTSEPYLLDQAGFPYQVFTPRSAGIDFYGDNLFTSEKEQKDHPERVKAFREASLKGWEYAMAHPDEMIELILKKYASGRTRDYLRFEARQMQGLVRADLVPLGYMNPGRWRHIADTYAEGGLLPAGFSLDQFIYEANPSIDLASYYRNLLIALLVIVLISALALYVLYLNRLQLRNSRALAHRNQEVMLHNEVLELISRGAPQQEIFAALSKRVEALHPGALCSVLLLDESGQHLRLGAAPSLPDFYNQAVDGLQIGEARGSCGTAAFRGEPVIVENIREHPYWQGFQELAERAGLGACWSQPFKSADGRVLGTFAIYHRQPSAPSETEIRLIESYANLASLTVERDNAAKALVRTEARYRMIADNCNDVIWLMELPQMRFSYVSPSIERLSGWTVDEVIVQPLEAIVMPASLEDIKVLMAESLARLASGDAAARLVSLELDQPCKDGRIITVEAVATFLLDAQGQATQLLGVTRDISERKRIDKELAHYRQSLEQMVDERTAALSVAKDAAEAANRAKSTFLANMSHELRTPMNAIMGLTGLALRRAVDERQQEQLAKVAVASRHLLAIINDVLDLSRIEAERLTLADIPFRLGSVIDSLIPPMTERAAEKGLELITRIAPETHALNIQGDPLRLAQVLVNLMGNAIKFTPTGSVTLTIVPAPAETAMTLLRFEISDTGIGIAMNDQLRLFNPFEQVDGSTTRRYGGAGLGLSICRRLARLMGGEMGLSSEPGVGSTFWFTILTTLTDDREVADSPDALAAAGDVASLIRESS